MEVREGQRVALQRIPTPVGRLAVRDPGGDGRPIVLWPSLFSDHHLYDRLVPLVAPAWRTILIDGPGFGDSDAPGRRIQPPAYADAVCAVLDALDLPMCTFAGTSWGGQIGAWLAAAHPDRVAALLMMNTPMRPSEGGHLFEVAMARLFVDRAFYARGVARAMFAPSTVRHNADAVRAFVARFRTFDRRASAITAATTLRHFAGLAPILPRIVIPTCVLMGADDPLYPPDSVADLVALIPGASVAVVPECGHLAPLEAPAAVAAALAAIAT